MMTRKEVERIVGIFKNHTLLSGVCASWVTSFPVSRRKLHDRECCVTLFRQGGYTTLCR